MIMNNFINPVKDNNIKNDLLEAGIPHEMIYIGAEQPPLISMVWINSLMSDPDSVMIFYDNTWKRVPVYTFSQDKTLVVNIINDHDSYINGLKIESDFKYHAPKEEQIEKYNKIREVAKDYAILLNDLCPRSKEKNKALEELNSVVMWANAAIARNA